MTRFDKNYCSQCGGEFGPGDHGYSHCEDHRPKTKYEAASANAFEGVWPKIMRAISISEGEARAIFGLGFSHGGLYATDNALAMVKETRDEEGDR